MPESWKLVLKSAWITIASILALGGLALCGLWFLIDSLSLKDCGWNGTVVAYLDTNENAHFDSGESMLAGVPAYVNDLYNHFTKMSQTATDEHGIAHLDLFIAGCPKVNLQVQVDVPRGYKATSPSVLPAKKDFLGRHEMGATYYFGFAKLP